MTLDVMYSAASILVLVYFIYQCVTDQKKSHQWLFFNGRNTIHTINKIKTMPPITAGNK